MFLRFKRVFVDEVVEERGLRDFLGRHHLQADHYLLKGVVLTSFYAYVVAGKICAGVIMQTKYGSFVY